VTNSPQAGRVNVAQAIRVAARATRGMVGLFPRKVACRRVRDLAVFISVLSVRPNSSCARPWDDGRISRLPSPLLLKRYCATCRMLARSASSAKLGTTVFMLHVLAGLGFVVKLLVGPFCRKGPRPVCLFYRFARSRSASGTYLFLTVPSSIIIHEQGDSKTLFFLDKPFSTPDHAGPRKKAKKGARPRQFGSFFRRLNGYPFCGPFPW
jgi:hypothetical protein